LPKVVPEGSVVVVDVLVLVVEVVTVVLGVVDVVVDGGQAPHTLPRPTDMPPAAAHAGSSRAILPLVIGQSTAPSQPSGSGRQQTTASGFPHVERAAQRMMSRPASARQPDLRSALR
jgi:hypothetical protein